LKSKTTLASLSENRRAVIRESFLESSRNLQRLADLAPSLERAALTMVKAFKGGKKLVAFGNGGSAADAQHLTAELSGRFERDRPGLPAVALTTNSSTLTCVGNDYDFSQIFSRQMQGLVQKGDVVVAISTSGNSPNVLEAVREARRCGAFILGWTGEGGGKLKELSDLCLEAPSRRTARIQECHLAILHALCGMVENEMFPPSHGKK